MATRIGQRTVRFDRPPRISAAAAVVGKREGEGPLGALFDEVHADNLVNEASWEKAESRLQALALEAALRKGNCPSQAVDAVFAGDLLNQCIGSTFGLREFGIPLIGLYGACSTMALSLGCAALFVESGAARRAAAVTSSHFCAAERQYRFPIAYGGQRTPTAQWTVTGAGAVLLAAGERGAAVTAFTVGQISDLGVSDANNMGAAMAPAAADTVLRYFADTKTDPADYDGIFTGDLGQVGSELFCGLLAREGVSLAGKHADCGLLIYDRARQDVHAGGSGCGCSASVLCAALLPRLQRGEYRRILFCATGALLSPTSVQQGETIPSIAHLLCLTSGD